nr:ATP-binding cassette domain-containing protein [Phycicoccus avicenniae]
MHVDHVSHAYTPSGPPVLDDVALDITRGAVTALVGPNGAGKSTLLAAVSRLLGPDHGRVVVDGVDVARAPDREVARVLAVLRQDTRLSARLTVVDLVRFGRFPHSGGRLTTADHEVVAASLAHVGMADLRDRYLDELSGGQRQRAFIAMVLAQETPYVLLDEPLNNLDMEHAASVMRVLRTAADDLGRTVVVVLHDVNMAAAWADDVVGMRDGRVVARGRPAEVLRTDVLREVFGIEIPVVTVDGSPVALHWLPRAGRHPMGVGQRY